MKKTYIISYPRSGNTLFRTIMEYHSKQPTDGTCDNPAHKNRLMKPIIYKTRTNFIAYKTHVWDVINPEDKVFFIIRDYKECIIRHNQKHRGISFELFKKQTRGENNDYIDLLQKFDSHPGPKYIIYYEDMIKGKLGELSHMIKDDAEFNLIRQIGLTAYPESETKGADIHFHSKKLSNEDSKNWDNYLKTFYPDLFKKYLKRYENKSCE